MKRKKIFPKIHVLRSGRGFEGVGGLKLKSILKGDLLLDKSSLYEESNPFLNRLNPKTQQRSREDFLHAISSWPSSTTLELHLTALPDLLYRPKGNLWITIFIRSFDSSKEKVKEDIISRYLGLAPILSAFIPEAEFVPITNEVELKERIVPFEPAHALAVQRREKSISLSAPLRRLSVGFGKVEEKGVKNENVVRHLFPWTPSYDDSSNLISILMGQLDPVQIIIRLKPIKASQNTLDRLRKNIQVCELFLSGIK